LESAPRYRDLIDRLLGEDLDFLPPGFTLDLPGVSYELDFLRGVRWWSTGAISQIGDGTHFAQLEVSNPPGSGLVSVVTKVWGQPNNTTGYDLILDGTASAGAIIKLIPLDTRVATITTQASAGKPDLAIGSQQLIDEITLGPGGTASFDPIFHSPPVILSPGHRLKIEANTVNITIIAAMFGYERKARPEELAA
jgi:hypothetical protein